MRRQTQTVHSFRSFIYSFPTQQDCVLPVVPPKTEILTSKMLASFSRTISTVLINILLSSYVLYRDTKKCSQKIAKLIK